MIVDAALYRNGVRDPEPFDVSRRFHTPRERTTFLWVGLFEPTEAEFEAVRDEFNLHPLAVEDAIKAHQRPKLEFFEDSAFMVLRTARYLDESETVEFGELQLFIGQGFVVTVRHGAAAPLNDVRHGLEADPDKLACGPAAVLHAVVDHVVDGYVPVLAGLEDDIGEVEEEVFSPSGHNPVERIYYLKREVLGMIRATSSLQEPLERLTRLHEVDYLHDDIGHYFRDVLDHIVRVLEQVNGFNEMLTSILEANLTRVSIRQNEDMKKMAAWAAIGIVPTALAGVYGMNFRHMPELQWRYGYPLALATIVVVCYLLYRNFKRVGWL
ncbi:MAG: magnesium/cobalt transporter CorA [Acidimicrobiales bacterium]|nr:magnesium/cobalt transporter CorA [Acidimicrobiales bacterium]MCB9373997.1 magnesium/cobalt transporter CorA [Microthrixaceae bacterium]